MSNGERQKKMRESWWGRGKLGVRERKREEVTDRRGYVDRRKDGLLVGNQPSLT